MRKQAVIRTHKAVYGQCVSSRSLWHCKCQCATLCKNVVTPAQGYQSQLLFLAQDENGAAVVDIPSRLSSLTSHSHTAHHILLHLRVVVVANLQDLSGNGK